MITSYTWYRYVVQGTLAVCTRCALLPLVNRATLPNRKHFVTKDDDIRTNPLS